MLRQSRNVMAILLGTAVYAFGLQFFIIPNELMEGGLTGIALLFHYAAGIPPSITTLLLNIPLFAIGWRAFGRAALAYTGLGTVALSFFLWLMEWLIHEGYIVPFLARQDYFLATLYAGVTLGAGLGIVFRFGGTTGGSDIIASLVHKKRGISMGQFILAFDVVVIGSSLLYIPREKVLYTLVAVFVSSRVIDFITEGAYAAKAFTIITDDGENMSRTITLSMDRGVTLIPGKGAFSQQEKHIIYCVVARHEMRRLQSLARSVDPRCFIIISDVHDVLGEGFREPG